MKKLSLAIIAAFMNLFGAFSFNDAAALAFVAINYHQFATDAAFWKFDE